MTTVVLQAPAGLYGTQIQASGSGRTYAVDPVTGQVTVQECDALALYRAGFTVITATEAPVIAAELSAAAIPQNDATGGTVAAPVDDQGGLNTTGI